MSIKCDDTSVSFDAVPASYWTDRQTEFVKQYRDLHADAQQKPKVWSAGREAKAVSPNTPRLAICLQQNV